MRKDEINQGDIVLIRARVTGKHKGRFPIDIKLLGDKGFYVSNADIVGKVND